MGNGCFKCENKIETETTKKNSAKQICIKACWKIAWMCVNLIFISQKEIAEKKKQERETAAKTSRRRR